MTQNGKLYLPQSGFPSSKLLCNRKWTSCANGLFCKNEAIIHSKLRPLADFFAVFLQIFVFSPLAWPVGTPLIKLWKAVFRRQRKNCRGQRHQTDTFQAEISLTEDVSFYTVIYGGKNTLLCCLHVIFNCLIPQMTERWRLDVGQIQEVDRMSSGSPFFCVKFMWNSLAWAHSF